MINKISKSPAFSGITSRQLNQKLDLQPRTLHPAAAARINAQGFYQEEQGGNGGWYALGLLAAATAFRFAAKHGKIPGSIGESSQRLVASIETPVKNFFKRFVNKADDIADNTAKNMADKVAAEKVAEKNAGGIKTQLKARLKAKNEAAAANRETRPVREKSSETVTEQLREHLIGNTPVS